MLVILLESIERVGELITSWYTFWWNFLIGIATQIVNAFFKPIWDAIEDYITNIGEKMHILLTEYNENGEISFEALEDWLAAIFTPFVTTMLIILEILILIAEIALKIGSGGADTFAVMILTAVLGVTISLAAPAIGNALSGFAKFTKDAFNNLGIIGTLALFVNTIVFILAYTFTKINSVGATGSTLAAFFAFIAILCGYFSEGKSSIQDGLAFSGVIFGIITWLLMIMVVSGTESKKKLSLPSGILVAIIFILGLIGIMFSAIAWPH